MALCSSVAVAHAKWDDDKRPRMDEKRMRERIELIKMWKLTKVQFTGQVVGFLIIYIRVGVGIGQTQKIHIIKNQGQDLI